MSDDNETGIHDQASAAESICANCQAPIGTRTGSTVSKCTPSATFCDPSANVVFRTADDVGFRVHDSYLKAASQFSQDMLENSIACSSAEDPIPVTETSQIFEIMLLIITGRPQSVLGRPPTSWASAARLYRLVDKYQVDGHQHWFSELCSKGAVKKPVQALMMACSRPSIDITLARYAIAEGFSTIAARDMFETRLFQDPKAEFEGHGRHGRVVQMLDASNMTLRFRIKLGFKESMAYSHTFANLAQGSAPNWNNLANRFVSNSRYIEHSLDKLA